MRTFVLCLIAAPLWAQTFQGGIRGTLTDNTGATIPLAKMSLIEQATGISRSTISGEDGGYNFNGINPSTYTVMAEKPGFKTLQRKGIVVNTQEFLGVDLQMAVGEVSESVNVTAEVTSIETTNASTGQVVDNRKLSDLPNMGRNPFYQTVKISQNVTPGGDPKFNRMEDQSGSSQISIAGGPVRGNTYTLDGIPITDSINRAVIIPTIESVQEVKLQINTYDAEVGHTGGGTFNLYLKSGTNSLHASAFGYQWMNDWIANNFFANANPNSPPRVAQMFKNYGGSVGGRVVIPKLYDGRNKTFFFVTGEAYRQNQTSSTNLAVPTALEKTGDFSKSVYTNGTQQVIYDPLSTISNGSGGYTRQAFPGNIIPAARLNPIGVAMASYYPLPNVNTPFYGSNNYASTIGQYDRADQLTFKADQEITKWWRASMSYLHYGSREPGYRYFSQGGENVATPNQGMLVRHVDATQANTTITPSPTLVVAIRWGFNRFPNVTYPYSSLGFDVTKLGFSPTLAAELPVQAFPILTMSDLASYGGSTLSSTNYWSRSLNGSVSKYLGRHSLKTGVDYRVIHVGGTPAVNAGSYSFTASFTGKSPTSTVLGTGASLASMLVGYPASGSVTTAESLQQMAKGVGVFVQDDFRLTSKLTLNFGLRYEYDWGVSSPDNRLVVGFDQNAINPVQAEVPSLVTRGVLKYAAQNGYGTYATHPNQDKFAPRAGFAYALDPKTSIRGGYGLFWAPASGDLYSPFGYTQPNPYVASTDGNITPSGSLSNPFPNGILPPIGNTGGGLSGVGQSVTVFDEHAHSTRVHQYSFDIQHEFPAQFVLALGYSGSVTHQLILGTPTINIDQLPDQYLSLGSALNAKVPNPFYGTSGGILNLSAATVARAQLLLPFPEFTSVFVQGSDRGYARYNSVYFKAQKRMGHGLNFLNTVVWSRNTDTSNAASNTYNGQPTTSQDNYNRDAEWARASIDTPVRWTTAINYDLPFGKGRKWLARNTLADLAIGGWSINIQSTMQSGFPIAISQSNLNSAIGTSVQRPNATGISPVTNGSLEDRLLSYINPLAFSLTPQFSYGNVSRTIPMRGPGQAFTDFSLFKTFSIKERYKAQFRAEAFNITNTPVFNMLNTTFGSSTFGQITNQANYPRIVQLGVRFFF
jgi:hypothetical protein